MSVILYNLEKKPRKCLGLLLWVALMGNTDGDAMPPTTTAFARVLWKKGEARFKSDRVQHGGQGPILQVCKEVVRRNLNACCLAVMYCNVKDKS